MIEQQGNIVLADSRGFIPDPVLVKRMKGSFLPRTDSRFLIIVLISLVFHGLLIYKIRTEKLAPPKVMKLEELPERYAKLIIEKPIPKEEKKAAQNTMKEEAAKAAASEAQSQSSQKSSPAPELTPQQRAAARHAVAANIARVESRVRSVGVLSMLTGMGGTAKGAAVVNVLSSLGAGKEHLDNLDQTLANATGLQKAQNIDVLQKKLVKSKDVSVQQKEDIGDLIASVGVAKTAELAKRGDILIQKPQSIEGAASANEKRDNNAINAIVSTHKIGIKMSYEKCLQRNPSLQGKITIRFTITASGSVTAIKVLENTTGDAEFEQDIIRKIRLWQFDSIPDGDVTVTYPFIFTPAT